MLKHTLLYFFVFLLNFNSIAQQKFIKTIAENDFGVSIRVLPTDDLGWVVFSMDSLKLIKFNRCGEKEWTRHFLLPNTHNGLNYFIKTHNGGFALLTRNLIATKYGSLITKLDALGNIVWSKSLENIDFNQFPYTISEDATGNLFLFANVIHTNNSPSYSMISKIDANGILIWSRFYNYGVVWGGAITTSDNGILVRTGRDFIKIDGSGNLQWSTQINASFYYYLAAVEVSDGYIFTGYSNGNNLIGFYKMDKQGTLIGGTRQVSNFAGNPPMLYKTPNGNIAGVFNRGGSFNVHPTIVELDKDLNFVKQSSLGSSLYDLIGKDVCFLFDGTPVLAGVTNNNLQLFYAKMDEDYHTQCDVNLLNMTLTPETISQSFFNSTIT